MKIFLPVVIILFLAMTGGVIKADEYRIGPEDILSITFWQQPDLNTTITVRQDGKVSVPVIGEIVVAGKTTAELASDIVDKMSFYNPNISQSTVVVTQFNSRRVYLTGQVTTPGRLTFEVFPNVWEAIQQAGGPTETADLSRVKVISGETGKYEIVNVEKFLKEGDLTGIPLLFNNDNVDVPRYALTTNEGIIPRDFEGRKVFFIYGAVGDPGVMNLEEGMDVLDGIILAGGPITEANLKNVRIISKGEPYSQVTEVNVLEYSKNGYPARIPLKPEDTIVVPSGGSLWHSVLATIGDVLPIAATTSSIVIAISVYNSRD
ncbi:MAG: hypothetical protein GY855_00145 [candidate division Zixibacteria bacterium]|nr:hypothetical protein [candidate division Zixibacteria bacterium]